MANIKKIFISILLFMYQLWSIQSIESKQIARKSKFLGISGYLSGEQFKAFTTEKNYTANGL